MPLPTKFLIPVILLLIFGLAFGYYLNSNSGTSSSPKLSPNMTNPPLPSSDIYSEVTLTGTYVCLPHKNTDGPQTLECALGLESPKGTFYALDMTAIGNMTDKQVNTEITVTGTLVPIEAISSDHWQRYNVQGIIRVSSIK